MSNHFWQKQIKSLSGSKKVPEGLFSSDLGKQITRILNAKEIRFTHFAKKINIHWVKLANYLFQKKEFSKLEFFTIMSELNTIEQNKNYNEIIEEFVENKIV